MSWTTLCEFGELIEGTGKYVEISGFQLAVILSEGKAYVIDNTCPHAGGSLAGGWVKDGCIVCPWHCWPFRLDNGQLPDAPGVAITVYKTRLIQPQGKPQFVQADLPVF
jgi:nitrite reductase (NADH) small subunit